MQKQAAKAIKIDINAMIDWIESKLSVNERQKQSASVCLLKGNRRFQMRGQSTEIQNLAIRWGASLSVLACAAWRIPCQVYRCCVEATSPVWSTNSQ